MRSPDMPTSWKIWGWLGCVRGPHRLSCSPMKRGPKNMNHVCSVTVFVFNSLSYCLCRPCNYHSEILRINSSLSSLPCPRFLPRTCLWFGSHTWLPYNWLLLSISILSSCLVGGCCGSTKKTKKGENKEGECNWLWIKKEHLLVYHPKSQVSCPDPHMTLEITAPEILTFRLLSSSVMTLKFCATCPLEKRHTHTETYTHVLKPHCHLPCFSRTSSLFGQTLLPWVETSVFKRVEHKASRSF